MRKRKKLSRRRSKRVFRKGARFHKRNMRAAPMRGGIRL